MRLTFLMPADDLTCGHFAPALVAMTDSFVQILNEPAAAWRVRSEQAHARACACSWEPAALRLLSLINLSNKDPSREGPVHA